MKKKLASIKEGIETGAEKVNKEKSFLDMDFIEKQLNSLAELQKKKTGGNMEEERQDEYKNLLLKFDALVSLTILILYELILYRKKDSTLLNTTCSRLKMLMKKLLLKNKCKNRK
jgi:hypothetical protein